MLIVNAPLIAAFKINQMPNDLDCVFPRIENGSALRCCTDPAIQCIGSSAGAESNVIADRRQRDVIDENFDVKPGLGVESRNGTLSSIDDGNRSSFFQINSFVENDMVR